MQQNSTKECKNRYDWVGKMIYWELCKKLKFNHTDKCYMHKSESALENKKQKILSDLAIKTDSLIQKTRPNFT